MDKQVDKTIDKQMDKINQEFRGAAERARYLSPSSLPSLLSRGADINSSDPALGNTPLSIAILYESLNTVEYLVMAGADISKPDTSGNTPLIKALRFKMLKYLPTYENAEIIKFLLQQKADINKQNDFLQTPLHWILTAGYVDYPHCSPAITVLKVLLEADPRLDIRNDRGETVLDMVQNIPSSEKEIRSLFRNKLAEKKAKEKQLGEHEEAAYQKLLSENLESASASASASEFESEFEFEIVPEESSQTGHPKRRRKP